LAHFADSSRTSPNVREVSRADIDATSPTELKSRVVLIRSHIETGCVAPGGSAFQLTLELVEETPVSRVGNDLVGGGLDHPSFAQPQRVEP
jgi:hypothetical protein